MKYPKDLLQERSLNTKILIIDDNKELVGIIQEMLAPERYEIMSAADGQIGYSTFLLFNPDLVITDIHMPGKNGVELMKLIRTHKSMVKTIYMSGNLSRWNSLLEEEKTRYPVSILQKPFSRQELIRSLAQLSL
jgi:DNA-binding response OmpR family regulator